MAELSVAERLQPSLLDRLLDDAPQRAQEPREAGVLTRNGLRAAVLRDLGWLLNTTNLADRLSPGAWPQVETSVLNYGLPILSGGYASSVDIGQMQAAVRRAILAFEPRILAHSLHVEVVFDRSVLELHNQLALVIRGLLWAQPVPLEILLRAQVDLEEGAVRVTEAGR